MSDLRDKIAAIIGEVADCDVDYAREYADRILALLKMQWQPIKSAPNRQSVLVVAAGSVTVAWAENGCWSDERVENDPILPTHWMPLPLPPVQEKAR